MFYLDAIIKAAAVLSALGVIVGVVVALWRFIVKLSNTTTELNKTLDDLKAHSTENYMGILRLTIMSNEMPIGERIVAGHKYLANGGNGEVKAYLKKEFNITDTIDNAEHYKK